MPRGTLNFSFKNFTGFCNALASKNASKNGANSLIKWGNKMTAKITPITIIEIFMYFSFANKSPLVPFH
jgi:hypothetical protein